MNGQPLQLDRSALSRAAVPLAGPEALQTSARHNWALFVFVMLIPLQNIYAVHLPRLGGGLNFLNLMFFASLLLAWHCGGRLVRGSGLNGWVWLYIGMSLLALLVGLNRVSGSGDHYSILKDQMIAVAFVFLAQLSATDAIGVRRLLLASMIPLPYMLLVVMDQHQAVSSWHYSHDLRISGPFIDLGANELAAFFTTAMLVALGLLLGDRGGSRWRLLYALAAGCAGTGIILTYSRTAYVAALLGIGLIVLLRRGGLRLLLPFALVFMLLPAVLPVSVMERFGTITVEAETRDKSTDDRFRFWAIAKEQFGRHPLLGTGLHTFQHAEINPHLTDTHNFFLRELTEKGLVGGLVLLGLLLAMARLVWYALRRSVPGSLSYGLGLGLSGAFVALVCGNLFGDRFTHYPMIAHFWLYLGLLLRSLSLPQAADPEPGLEPEHARP